MASGLASALESTQTFESRKGDHIRVAMMDRVQAKSSGFDSLAFSHEAMPDLNFDDVSIESGSIFSNHKPLFVSSMTAGNSMGASLNERLAVAAARRGWMMGVGSQRRELQDAEASKEWKLLRAKCPQAELIGNIGLSQLIAAGSDRVLALLDALEGRAMIVHLNPLQEVLQVEGTPQFRGGLKAIEELVRRSPVPIIVKETGCGISAKTAGRLWDVGVNVIDVAGYGGTHWGRIEGVRAEEHSKASTSSEAEIRAQAAQTFATWGLSTVDSLRQCVHSLQARSDKTPRGSSAGTSMETREVWASGGVRSGLDVAKALHLGARKVGVAQPLMEAAMKSAEAVESKMLQMEFELQTTFFCVGAKNRAEFERAELLTLDFRSSGSRIVGERFI